MHKKEASKLFKILGDENRVKICKFLYNKGEMTIDELMEIVDCDKEQLAFHLTILVASKLATLREDITGEFYYSINIAVLNDLLSFITSPCQCMNK